MVPKGVIWQVRDLSFRGAARRTRRVGRGVWRMGGRWLVFGALALGTFGTGLTAAPEAIAGSPISDKRVLPYPYDTVWPTALRYLRVDRGFAVKDTSEAAGYILFEFALASDRSAQGSLEAFQTTDASGRPSVQVKVTTGAGPVYLPHAILEGLATKIRSERGPPAPPPPLDGPAPPRVDEPPTAAPDGGDGGPPPQLPPSREPGEDPAK